MTSMDTSGDLDDPGASGGDSSAAKIHFINNESVYLTGESIRVHFEIPTNTCVESKDWIGLYPEDFRSSYNDYCTFKWVSNAFESDSDQEEDNTKRAHDDVSTTVARGRPGVFTRCLQFMPEDLPSNDSDCPYVFAYVREQKTVLAVSPVLRIRNHQAPTKTIVEVEGEDGFLCLAAEDEVEQLKVQIQSTQLLDKDGSHDNDDDDSDSVVEISESDVPALHQLQQERLEVLQQHDDEQQWNDVAHPPVPSAEIFQPQISESPQSSFSVVDAGPARQPVYNVRAPPFQYVTRPSAIDSLQPDHGQGVASSRPSPMSGVSSFTGLQIGSPEPSIATVKTTLPVGDAPEGPASVSSGGAATDRPTSKEMESFVQVGVLPAPAGTWYSNEELGIPVTSLNAMGNPDFHPGQHQNPVQQPEGVLVQSGRDLPQSGRDHPQYGRDPPQSGAILQKSLGNNGENEYLPQYGKNAARFADKLRQSGRDLPSDVLARPMASAGNSPTTARLQPKPAPTELDDGLSDPIVFPPPTGSTGHRHRRALADEEPVEQERHQRRSAPRSRHGNQSTDRQPAEQTIVATLRQQLQEANAETRSQWAEIGSLKETVKMLQEKAITHNARHLSEQRLLKGELERLPEQHRHELAELRAENKRLRADRRHHGNAPTAAAAATSPSTAGAFIADIPWHSSWFVSAAAAERGHRLVDRERAEKAQLAEQLEKSVQDRARMDAVRSAMEERMAKLDERHHRNTAQAAKLAAAVEKLQVDKAMLEEELSGPLQAVKEKEDKLKQYISKLKSKCKKQEAEGKSLQAQKLALEDQVQQLFAVDTDMKQVQASMVPLILRIQTISANPMVCTGQYGDAPAADNRQHLSRLWLTDLVQQLATDYSALEVSIARQFERLVSEKEEMARRMEQHQRQLDGIRQHLEGAGVPEPRPRSPSPAVAAAAPGGGAGGGLAVAGAATSSEPRLVSPSPQVAVPRLARTPTAGAAVVLVAAPPLRSQLSLANLAQHNAAFKSHGGPGPIAPPQAPPGLFHPDAFIEPGFHDDVMPELEPNLNSPPVATATSTGAATGAASAASGGVLPAELEDQQHLHGGHHGDDDEDGGRDSRRHRLPPPGIRCPMCDKLSDQYPTVAMWEWHVNNHLDT